MVSCQDLLYILQRREALDNARLNLVKARWTKPDYRVVGDWVFHSMWHCKHAAFAAKVGKMQSGPVHS